MTYTESKHPQGSQEWWDARRGIPTASEFSRIVTPAKGDLAKGRTSYIADLVAARLGWVPSFDGNEHTVRGNLLESEALRWLQFRHGVKVRPAGFCLHESGKYGTSPDGFTSDGLPVEIKCPSLHTFVRWMLDGGLPPEHRVQCHGHMLVTGTDKCYFVAYAESDMIDNLMIVVERDEFTAKLADGVSKFCKELDLAQRAVYGENYDEIML